MAVRPGICGVIFAVVAGSLAGCTASAVPPPSVDSVQQTSTPSAVPSTPTTPDMPYLTVTPVLELNERTTKPGTKLKFGEQAVIPVYSRYGKGLLGRSATVETVKAADADIDGLPLKDEDKAKLRGKMFFFVKETLTNIDGANLTDVVPSSLTTSTKSGGWPGTLLGMGKIEVPGCPDRAYTRAKEFATKGATYEQCHLYFGVASDPITVLTYTDKPYEKDKGVTWRK